MSKITVTGQLTLTGGQLIAKETTGPAPSAGKELWSWGKGEYGQLGDGQTAVNKSSPIQIGSLTDWLSISSGFFHILARKTDGTIWSWGKNTTGHLGLGDNNINRSSPVQIGALTDWSIISGGQYHSLAIKTNGTAWAWGSNDNGQLGQGVGTAIKISSPVQIGALTDWASIAAGSKHSFAVKTNGELWSWGSNSAGRLGLGDTVLRSSPVQIGNLTTWSSVSGGDAFSLALKTDGTLWAWGDNSPLGQLGDGTVIDRNSPVQIGSLTTWSSIFAGTQHALAIKTNGELWGWGRNDRGHLGDGTIVNKSSPIQIGVLTDWSSISASDGRSAALKTDGTLWVWGRGSDGRLGDGTILDKSSPVQIGSLTTWSSVEVGYTQTHAIKTTT